MYTDPCTIALRFDKLMWDEIMDMPGEIFDLDIDDREMMPPDMQDDIEKEDPLLDWHELHWNSQGLE